MARRAVRRRSRSYAALLINPRKRRKSVAKRRRARRSNPRRRTAARRSRRANPRRRRVARRRRSSSRRRNPVRRRVARRRGRRNPKVKAYTRKSSVKAHRRRKAKRRSNPGRRRAPRVIYRRRSNPKRRRYGRRRNPAFVQSIASKLAGIPVIGGPLSKLARFAPHAALGAIAVEAPIMVSKQLATVQLPTWLEWLRKPVALFPVVGGLLGLAAMYAFPGSPETKMRVAIALAAGSAGAGYVLYRSQTDPTFEALTLGGIAPYGAVGMDYSGYGAIGMDYSGYGMAPAYTVEPGFGAVVLGG